MRLPLTPTEPCRLQLSTPSSSSDPPLLFIDNEPFLVELQGKLELPPGEEELARQENGGRGAMEGVRVGKVDLSDPKKPVLRIAHHRLEGKLETLLTPYALLRTTRTSSASSSSDASAPSDSKRLLPDDATAPSGAGDDGDSRAAKRAKLSPSSSQPSANADASSSSSDVPTTQIHLAAIIRRKLVFSRRPEPLLDVSSEADPAFLKEKRKGVKPHPLAGLGGPAGAAAAAAAGGASKGTA
ncbi:hypothetical protein JCM10207_004004 [Rhodosporidiobolus poonsookiae]